MGILLRGEKLGTIAEMNVVPLIDILLVLLVIFMMIPPPAQVGLPVDLPQQEDGRLPAPPDLIVVQVLGDGTVCINRDPVKWPDLQGRLEELFKMRASRAAFVSGDSALDFGVIARAIDVMRASGIVSAGLMTQELENSH
ncbi:MAG: biopolymer transporter ExbD [Candidatus Acidiferrum sp.]